MKEFGFALTTNTRTLLTSTAFPFFEAFRRFNKKIDIIEVSLSEGAGNIEVLEREFLSSGTSANATESGCSQSG